MAGSWWSPGGLESSRHWTSRRVMSEQRDANRGRACGGCAEVRGRIFTDLDRLAFALEMEAAERLAKGEGGKALRLESQRLGVRLAQRLVADVWTDEVHMRVDRWQREYEERMGRSRRARTG